MADESILSGGISNSIAEAPILPVQGGGGLGTNTHGIGEIKVVEGGQQNTGALPNVQIVMNYDILDKKQYADFLKKFTPTTNLEKAIKQVETKVKPEKILHYGAKGDISVLNSRNITNLVNIKIIPITTKKLVILPPFTTPEEYINQFMFLIRNDYMEIDSTNNFIIRKNVFVISLAPFNKDDKDLMIKYLYLKLKIINNMTSYYVVGEKFNVFLYPKEKGILVANEGFKLVKPIKPENLEPTNFDIINEYNIKSMKYRKSDDPTNIYSMDIITNGTTDTDIATSYNLTLNKYIAVISLIDEDIQTINVDLQGKKYRMRIPYVNNKTDKIYDDWLNGKYKMDEGKLVDDLHLEPKDEIPKFLFNLAYFKCFDDVSLLTKAECSSMKTTLDSLYKRALKNYEKIGDSDSEDKTRDPNKSNTKTITSIECNQIDTETPKKVRCTIKYTENNVSKEAIVELDENYIGMMATDKEKVNEAAKEKFLGSK